MSRLTSSLISIIFCLYFCPLYGQNTPDIIDGKDYNQSFYLKVKTYSSSAYWNNRFPENWQDTSNTVRIPINNNLRFQGQGTERGIGFSALFGFRWGKIGGGFEGSRMDIDSLSEDISDTTLKISYSDSEGRLGFNKFFVEFESNPLSLTPKSDINLVFNLMLGTTVLSPVNSAVLTNSSFFVNLGPQLEIPVNRWLTGLIGGFYEMRYFNQKEEFFLKEWVFHNTIHNMGINVSLRFRIYEEDSNKEKPLEQRVK